MMKLVILHQNAIYSNQPTIFSGIFDITTNLLHAFINQDKRASPENLVEKEKKTMLFAVSEFFEEIKRGKCPPINSLKEGGMLVITTTESNNGIVGYYDIPEFIENENGKKIQMIEKDCITISANGSSCCAFYQPYEFSANADVLICKLKEKYNNLYFKMFLCSAIRNSAWKFTYYRKCSNTKLLNDVKIAIPMNNNDIDYEFIINSVDNSIGFSLLKERLQNDKYFTQATSSQ